MTAFLLIFLSIQGTYFNALSAEYAVNVVNFSMKFRDVNSSRTDLSAFSA